MAENFNQTRAGHTGTEQGQRPSQKQQDDKSGVDFDRQNPMENEKQKEQQRKEQQNREKEMHTQGKDQESGTNQSQRSGQGQNR